MPPHKDLQKKAKKIRRNIVQMITHAKSGHIGSSLSCVEILVALYFKKMRHDPRRPTWENRDRFVLSKGHAAPALYATLAEAGYFPPSELTTLRRIDSNLPGHPTMGTKGIDFSSGSLGQGLSVAVGMALSAKMNNQDYHTYALLGDGELQEGQIWEALMSASHHKLNNLTVIIDRNILQTGGRTEDIMALEPLIPKLGSFNFNVSVSVDGHNFSQLLNAMAPILDDTHPSAIVADTIKGKGVSFIEGNLEFHDRIPTDEELKKAMGELS